MMSAMRRWLTEAGLHIEDGMVEQLARHAAEIQRYNRRLNLVADDRTEVLIRRHIIDSALGLRAVRILAPPGRPRVVDVGSGGGFPGVVAAVLSPDWEVVLVDSSSRKVGFLLRVIEVLGVDNLRVIRARAEDIAGGRGAAPLPFDMCLSRAVAPISCLAALCGPLLRDGGLAAWWKGPGIGAEMEEGAPAVEKYNLKPVSRYLYRLPREDISRAIFLAQRVRARR